MKQIVGVRRWLIIGSVAGVAFDTVGSIAARALEFDYVSLWPVGIALAVSVAFLAGRATGLVRAGVLTGVSLEFANATVGWAVSWLIGPGEPAPPDRHWLPVLVVVIVVTAFGAVEGLVGGWLGARVGRNRATQPASTQVAQTEHQEESSAAADAERLLEAELGDQIHLKRERAKLPRLLASGETVLAVASSGLRSGRPGVLAVTDRRLIHVYNRHFFRHFGITEISYEWVDTVYLDGWRSLVQLRVSLNQYRRVSLFPIRIIGFPVMGGAERASELTTCIRNAVSRFQDPVKKKTGPPLKTVG